MEERMDIIWRQKSRENWIRFGDANSKFFHTSTIIKRRQNFIGCVEDSHGVWLSDREEIGNYFNHHFRDIFELTESTIDNEFSMFFEDKVTDAESDYIGRSPNSEEIKDIVFKMHPLKVPGPDGFPRIFYRKYWHTVGPQLCEMVKGFFESGVLNKKLNHSYICLILKNPNASSEVLSKFIARAERNGEISAVRIAKSAVPISHLLYADDSIFYFHATAANADSLMNYICKYEGWSGQRVNKQKSGLVFSPNTSRRCRDDIKESLGISCLNSREKYLRNPFFFTASKRRDNQFLKEKILSRLEGWKARHVAQAGRSVLISFVLQSIPNYFMSMVLVPKMLCNDLDRILAKFWWLGISDRNRYCALKSWNELCQPKKSGGLGFRRFADMNVALLTKLFWMVLKDDNKVWVSVLRDKYCRLMSPWSVERKAIDSRCWKSILEARRVYLDGAGLIVADGSSELWDRPWVPHRNMEELKTHFRIRHNQAFWNIKDLFVDRLRVWNEELIQDCFNPTIAEEILQIRPLEEGADILFWKASKSGVFLVKNAYWISQQHRFKETCNMWSKLWKSSLHPRLQLGLIMGWVGRVEEISMGQPN
uniref:Reverse transcriptase n=1 Tax=Cannabis sativa TaxID=3483 RepID=A0A803NZ56_CANSA